VIQNLEKEKEIERKREYVREKGIERLSEKAKYKLR